MDGYQSRMIAELRTAIKNGTLSSSEIDRRLTGAITREIGKTSGEADGEFIKVCQDLLGKLNGYNGEPSDALRQKSLEVASEKLSRRRQRRSFTRTSLRIAVVTAAIIVVSVVGNQVIRREWLEGSSSNNQQQYTVSGKEVDLGLVDSGKAALTADGNEIVTTHFSDVVRMLGDAPLMPSWYPDGWRIDEYYVQAVEVYQLFYVLLQSSETNEVIKFESILYSSIEDAEASFEQNEAGDSILCNGWDVYFTQNVDKQMAVWIDGATCYSLFGPLSKTELITIIESIQRSVP